MQREPEIGPWFFDNSLYHSHPHLDTAFHLRQPLIGIGAPAGMFLKPVAEALHTELILPEHFQVANALGAVAGTVMVTEEILVCPELDAGRHGGARLLHPVGRRAGSCSRSSALPSHMRARSPENVPWAAPCAPGQIIPKSSCVETSDGLDTYRVRARAMGKPRLAR